MGAVVAQAVGSSVLAWPMVRCLLALSADAAGSARHAGRGRADANHVGRLARRRHCHGRRGSSVSPQNVCAADGQYGADWRGELQKAAIRGQRSSPARWYLGKVRSAGCFACIADPAAAPGLRLFSPASGEQVIGNLVNVAPVDGGVEALWCSCRRWKAGVHLGGKAARGWRC